MLTNVISAIVSLFILSSPMDGKENEKLDAFLEGSWTVNTKDNNSPLESVNFSAGNVVSFIFSNEKEISSKFTQLYAYESVDAATKTLSLTVYSRDLFSDKKTMSTNVDIEVVSQDIIKLKRDKKVFTLKRAERLMPRAL